MSCTVQVSRTMVWVGRFCPNVLGAAVHYMQRLKFDTPSNLHSFSLPVAYLLTHRLEVYHIFFLPTCQHMTVPTDWRTHVRPYRGTSQVQMMGRRDSRTTNVLW